ncbi:dihydrolipoyl dehydrogenase family protein [Streptomyces sp. NPDC054834]
MRDLRVDVVVVGAGPAGENAAGRCADAGLSVAVVERQLVGGECSYWGCIPSKTLIRPGDVLAAARRVPGAAEAVTGGVDARDAFAQRDYMTGHWDDSGQEKWLADRSITLLRGPGRLAGERLVEVAAEDGDTTRVRAGRAVVLATGTTALIPPVDGLREIRVWDNRGATAAKELPARLLVLGGGAIGAELAQGFHRLGCPDVTVVEGTDRLVPREEPFAGEELRTAFETEGITVITGVLLESVRREPPDAPVEATLADGRHLVADEILVAVGRRPATADLGLETVGLRPGRFVEVDDLMRATGVPGGWLYAIGDCNGRALLTHMGKYQGRIAGDVIAGKDALAATDVVPRVTFTDPQVAAVGLTEAQAREQRLPVRAVTYGIGDVPGSYVQGNGLGGTGMLVVDTERRIVVGATFTGQYVQELLHSATVAVVGRLPLEVLGQAVPSFPTVSEVWLHLLEQCGV